MITQLTPKMHGKKITFIKDGKECEGVIFYDETSGYKYFILQNRWNGSSPNKSWKSFGYEYSYTVDIEGDLLRYGITNAKFVEPEIVEGYTIF